MLDDDKISEDLDSLNEAQPLDGKDWIDVARDATVFQLKLVLDGLLDIIMVPVSLVAAGMSIATGQDWFYRTIRVGRGLDARLNLFGCGGPSDVELRPPEEQKDQIDELALRIEQEIRREIAEGNLQMSARESLGKLRSRLDRLRDKDGTDFGDSV
ncbi:MAG: hypothetical protein AAFZ58_03145 [Pseudomonadota bacterium]